MTSVSQHRPTSGPRHLWVDAARGCVVIMVVVMHVGLYHFQPLALDAVAGNDSPALDFWIGVDSALHLLRMPALLVLSGWLASSRIREGLGSRRTRRSIYANAYLYLLWLAIYTGVTVLFDAGDVAQAPTPETWWMQLWKPYTTLWFLSALVWYTTAMSLLRRFPPPLVLVGMFLLGWVSSSLWTVDEGLWANIPHLAIFFAMGVYARPAVALLTRHPVRSFGIGLAGTIVFVEIVQRIGTQFLFYPVDVIAALCGVATIFAGTSLAAHWAAPVVRPIAWVGRRTLPIYVTHYLVLLVLTKTDSGPLSDIPELMISQEATRWIYPALLTAVIVGTALALKEICDRIGLRWLFALPHLPHPSRYLLTPRQFITQVRGLPRQPATIPAAPVIVVAPRPDGHTPPPETDEDHAHRNWATTPSRAQPVP
ncbi:hypothetical protein KEM60_02917 [Austwickia sp. TVS 96-490-7B]|nr:hypothetical protein [Austwickia sp. TVS 96-490-7B]